MVVPVQTSLSLTSRWLTRVIAVTYLLLGLVMFVAPGWSAHHFPWKVSSGLVAIIVIATLLNIGIFHFSAHPRHVVYLATYVVVMIGAMAILWWDRRETGHAAEPAGLAGAPGPAGTCGRTVDAQVAQDACAALRALGPAGRAPVGDHREVQVVPDAGRHPWREEQVRLVRGRVRRDPPQSGGDAMDMGVDGESGPPHGEDEHACGRLGPHSGQREEIGLSRRIIEISQAAEVDAALAFLDGGQDLLDAARLLVGDAAAADRLGHLLDGRVRDLLPGGEPLLQPGERPLGVDVRGVLRQDGRHDLVDDRQPRLGHECALLGPQPLLHLRDGLLAGRRYEPLLLSGAGRCCDEVTATRQLLA